ncbi:protein-methionine-sulfoxide reductase catalytic subunit MsrP [Pseudothauera nasutitermitis]|uniref:Protein-methionine-sulfoxide reductase catalytic subunit MsrP n=1 Tax=Pseudothauera nasutitermitis TaxID=2565930 RepID=A0A4S4AR91_9RHOO|nr:protein-methionine-sulfoxide reductase catalytic subunit MsrP [Pseudothauera nasutitermitis]THF62321.1 protein-methionine-sulfoxide reductase catalytic subunit MsrP [Pseudothauera nasutitermitis]
MLIRRPADIAPSEITARELFEGRREFIRRAGLGLAAGAALWHGLPAPARAADALPRTVPGPFSIGEPLTKLESAISYNNFYEFGVTKSGPERNAHRMQVRPWTLRVEGLVCKPREFGIEELLKLAPMEERIYRLRCVEAWSMVIPWAGYPLAALLKAVEPLGSAKYVEFVTHYDPAIMNTRQVIEWPYHEGLRLDEALHPLTLLTFGMYGELLPNQNGAPVRIVVPWKYGFKSAKSIVTLRLLEEQPATAWIKQAPQEYGFYANVNPEVSHPRWNQATERRIGEQRRRPTLMFNGYAEQVAQLYQGMDLHKHY